jgi:hypothetical protein
MTQERRLHDRVPLNLPAKYDGLSGAHETRIDDIGMGGCFVNTQGRVDLGEVITVEIKLLSGEWLQLRGQVTSYQPGIGFGMVFSFLKDEEEQALQQLISGQ